MDNSSSKQLINNIAFFGFSGSVPGDDNFESARTVARTVARSGRIVVNGGGPGIMLAATLGARDVGGKSVAVYFRPELATTFEGKNAANLADEHFEEANYILRTKKLLELGDAYIVFNGGTGTISEFAMAWGLARLYFGHHKPLLLYGAFWHDVMEVFKRSMLSRPEEYQVFTIVESPNAAMEAIEKYEAVLAKNRHHHKNCTGTECSFLL